MLLTKHLSPLFAALFFSLSPLFLPSLSLSSPHSPSSPKKQEEALCRENSSSDLSELEERVNNFFPRVKPLEKKEITGQPMPQIIPYPEITPPPRKNTFSNFNPYTVLNKFNFQQLFPGVRPYLSSGIFPQQHLALGTLLEHPLGVTRLTFRGFTDYLQNPHDAQLQIEEQAETTLVLFDDGAERKMLGYYVRDAFTMSTLGKMNNISELYSQIDGLIVRVRVEERGYQGQLVWAAPGNFFIGGRYFVQQQQQQMQMTEAGAVPQAVPGVSAIFGNDLWYGSITIPVLPGPLQGTLGVYGFLGGFVYTLESSLSPEETRIEARVMGNFYELDLVK